MILKDPDLLQLAFEYGLLKESEADYAPEPPSDAVVSEVLKKYPELAHKPKAQEKPTEKKASVCAQYHDKLERIRRG